MDYSTTFYCAVYANTAFWLASALNLVVDSLVAQNIRENREKPSFFRRLRLQNGPPLSKNEIWDVICLAGLNMLLIAPLLCVPCFEWVWENLHGQDRLSTQDLWQWQRELPRIPIDMLVNEFTFYGAHYLMHEVAFLYRHVHKVHHRFHAPTAMAAAYAHPLEFIFGNVLCIAAGPILTNAHPFTAYFWFAAALLSTCKGHCGYDFLNAATHDAHHEYTNCNYGVLHGADFVFGTSLPKDVSKR